MSELIILEIGVDEFICVSGERIETQAAPNFYPFGHAVTLRLCARDAARIGQEVITVAASEILQDCELPAAETEVTQAAKLPTKQLTLFGDAEPEQTALF